MPKQHTGRKLLLGAGAAGAAYFAVGHFLYEQLLSRQAATRGFNSLKKEDILAGRQSDEKQSLIDRVALGLVGDAAGFGGFFEKPFFPVYQAGAKWYYERDIKKAAIPSPNGGHIHAEIIENESASGLWLICLHGYGNSPRDYGSLAETYYGWGFNILLPHLGGHNESESRAVSMGWLDRLDVVEWINYLIRTYDNPRIVLHGFSMGSATVMMATGEALPPNVICAISDCGYTSVWDEYAAQARASFHMPPFPALYALEAVTKRRAGFSLKEASSVEQLKKSKTPTLFIHGVADTFVPFRMLDENYNAAACEKEKLAVPGAGHAESVYQRELYFGAVKEFIDKYLPQSPHLT